MSDHEERVTEEQLVKLRQGIIAGDLSIFTIAAHIDAMKAERDAAVRRAEEAEAEVVRAHLFACWGWTSMELTGEEVRVLLADACVICRRVLGKGEG